MRIASTEKILIDRAISIEFLQDLIEREERIACWRIMSSIDARHTPLREPRSHQMVGKDHRFFDELGGFGPLSIADARGRALIIKNRTCFNAIEFHAACAYLRS